MSLPHGLLGLLSYADSTGYDLSKLFAESLNFFWNAPGSQIYRELDRMEKTGWVSSRGIVQEGRPNKRLYSITASGREELTRWLTDFQYKPENPHSAIIMRVFYGAEIDPEKTVELLKEFRRKCAEELDSIRKIGMPNVDVYSRIFPGGDLKKAYWEIAVDSGMSKLRALIKWADRSIETLKGVNK